MITNQINSTSLHKTIYRLVQHKVKLSFIFHKIKEEKLYRFLNHIFLFCFVFFTQFLFTPIKFLCPQSLNLCFDLGGRRYGESSTMVLQSTDKETDSHGQVTQNYALFYRIISNKIHCFQFYVKEANKAAQLQCQLMMDKEKAYLFHIQLVKNLLNNSSLRKKFVK